MKEQIFSIKGNICYSRDKNHLEIMDDGYAVCENGKSLGVFSKLPACYEDIPCVDYSNLLIVPGLIDLHVHAPQFSYRGLGMDLELLDWLNENAFPEESKFENIDYAKKSYSIFTESLRKSATTRAAVFATLHVEATKILMQLIEESGLKAVVGKVNMDRNAPDYLREKSSEQSAIDTEQWIEDTIEKYQNVKPILTPRFIPSCSDSLMKELSILQKKYNLSLQSHLSENLSEINLVKNLCPDTNFYGEAYHKEGLFGGECPTIMAHCVFSSSEEIDLMKEKGVFVAHCPQSNTNLASGIAPIRTYLDRDLLVGLGSDIAGGYSESIFRAMSDAIQASKLYWRLIDKTAKPLTAEEAFYMGTKGGGAFFGKVGSFEPGYEFDAVVLDDRNLPHPQELNTMQRLERMIYLSDDRNIVGKYVAGNKIY